MNLAQTIVDKLIEADEDLRRLARAGGVFGPYKNINQIKRVAHRLPEYTPEENASKRLWFESLGYFVRPKGPPRRLWKWVASLSDAGPAYRVPVLDFIYLTDSTSKKPKPQGSWPTREGGMYVGDPDQEVCDRMRPSVTDFIERLKTIAEFGGYHSHFPLPL